MREENIEKMNFKELRAEVRLLRDELAVFKRKYEDAIYNLDSDNFGKSFTVERNNMKAQIKVTADAIKTMVSDTDLKSALENYSTVTQTANAIQTVVSKGARLQDAIAINSLTQAEDKTAIYVIAEKDAQGRTVGEKYYYYNELLGDWEILSGDSIYTVFNQTPAGFELKGNVVIDGNTVITKNLTLSGNVTWSMENSPVLTRYSSDGLNWHSPMVNGDMYMQMSFDGGVNWSTSTKVVGTDGENGRDGHDGSDASVTPQNVFNALTDDGEKQGLFSAFYDNGNKLFINAEYIGTENLACTRLYAKENIDGYSARLNGNWGDFGIFTPDASENAKANAEACMWGVYQSDVVTEAVNFYSYGLNYLGINGSNGATYPKGDWDFSSCNVVEWGNNAPIAVFG